VVLADPLDHRIDEGDIIDLLGSGMKAARAVVPCLGVFAEILGRHLVGPSRLRVRDDE
jgi:hypothetical protein